MKEERKMTTPRKVADAESAARVYAADCAEHVLHLFERVYPNDRRPRAAIEATRAFARGDIGRAKRVAAAVAAAASHKKAMRDVRKYGAARKHLSWRAALQAALAAAWAASAVAAPVAAWV